MMCHMNERHKFVIEQPKVQVVLIVLKGERYVNL